MAGPMERTSLAACQKDAMVPARVGIAIHLAIQVAQVARAAPRGPISPDNVLLGYDGSVELGAGDGRPSPAYLAPEQVTGGDVDRRAEVFSLGILLWELLAGKSLFARETASETRIAVVDDPIPDVRADRPDVSTNVADVLATALQRDRNARFDTVEAFAKALGSARASSGLAEITRDELARWVAERVPRVQGGPASAAAASAPAVAVPDLDVRGTSRTHRSQTSMAAVKVPSDPASIPAFDVNAMAAAALAPSTRGSVPSAAPASDRTSAPGRQASPSAPSAAPAHGGGKSIDFAAGDEDDFDMEIERNVAGSMPTATSTRPSGAHGAARPSQAGLELAAPSRMAREGAPARRSGSYEPSTGSKLAGLALGAALAGGTAFGLWKYVHHAGGRDPTRLLPHAFDGSSATESGAVSLVALVVAVVVGYAGLRVKPHAWAIIAAAGAMLLMSLAMVTVTLASTGENPTPPDGVLLIPYLFPTAVLFLALGLLGRATRRFARGGTGRRVTSLPLAAIAGALAFAAFEISRLAR